MKTQQDNVIKLLRSNSPKNLEDLNREYWPDEDFYNDVLKPLIKDGIIEELKDDSVKDVYDESINYKCKRFSIV